MKPGDLDKLGRRYGFKRKPCATCAEIFQPTNGLNKYCSEACRWEAQLAEYVCEECGVAFKREKHKWRRFCSTLCSARATAREGRMVPKFQPTGTCPTCGEEFGRKNPKQRYCRKECKPPPHKWCLETKGEQECRNCPEVATHLHHIVPRRKNPRVSADVKTNGIPLCRECHYGWHYRCVEVIRHALTVEEYEAACAAAGKAWVDRNYPVPEEIWPYLTVTEQVELVQRTGGLREAYEYLTSEVPV